MQNKEVCVLLPFYNEEEILGEVISNLKNNDYFVLERSVDGVIWVDIAQLDGKGTTSEPTNYKVEDKEFKDNF